MTKRITVLVLDNHPRASSGFVAGLSSEPGFEVLATADLDDALRQVRERRPDIVLLHRNPKRDDRLTLAVALHAGVPASRLILLGLRSKSEDVAGFVRAGVSCFIMAGAPLERLLAGIGSVMRGQMVLPSELTATLFAQLGGSKRRRRDAQRRIQPLERLA